MLPVMPYNHQRPKLIMSILTVLGMVVATSAVTLLCIRFGMVMTKTPIQAGKVYHTTDDRSIAHNRGKLLVVTTLPDTTVEVNASDDSISQDQQRMWISLPGSTFTASKNQSPTNYSSFKHLQQGNYSRSLSDIGLVEDDSFLVRTSTSKSMARPIDLRDASINTNPHNINGNITTLSDNSENNDEDVTNTNKYQINGRQISRRKINHNHQLNTNMAKYAMVAEEDSSNGYQNAYDSTYNVGDYGHKEYENPSYEAGWTSAGRPEQSQGSLWSGSSGSWAPPPYGPGEGYLADQDPNRKPLDRPSSNPTKNDLNPLQPKLNNINNWRIFVLLALFKLGLAKLQVIGFLNTLFQLGFSFKLYMTAVFFNFILIMKLMKFFKILLLPLLLTRLLPLFMQLLMMPARLLDLLRRLNDNNMPASQPGGSLPSQPGGSPPSQPGGLLPSRPGGLLPSQPGGARPGGLQPNQQGAAVPGSTQRGGMVRATGKVNPTGESTSDNYYNVADKTNESFFKLEDKHLTDVQSDESTQLSDPTIDILQKLLDSEKCVERIACRISMAEKTGNVPIWINWVLHRVHKFIPSDKLESYLKAYTDVNDEIRAKSSVPDNWVTWCLERYNCNSSDNTTNVLNARQ